MRIIIIDLQSSDTRKTQSAIVINFISSKDTKEVRVMHVTSANIKFTSYNDAYEVVNELLESLRSKYQDNLEKSLRRSTFISDSVRLMYYKCHKVNFKRGGSYIGSPDWVEKKKTTINPKNTDINAFNTQQLLH